MFILNMNSANIKKASNEYKFAYIFIAFGLGISVSLYTTTVVPASTVARLPDCTVERAKCTSALLLSALCCAAGAA